MDSMNHSIGESTSKRKGEKDEDGCQHEDRCPHCKGVSLLDHGYYWFTGSVRDSSVQGTRYDLLKMVLDRKEAVRPGMHPNITIFLESLGGEVMPGLALYSTIRDLASQYGVSFTMRVEGVAASMGMTLLQAGDFRSVSPNAFLMIHSVSSMNGGSYHEQKDHMKLIEAMMQRMAEIYAQRNTKGNTDPEFWLKEMERKEMWMTAQEALDLGLVDEIR